MSVIYLNKPVEMKIHQNLKSASSTKAIGKGLFVGPEHHKDWGEDKIDALKKLFGKQVSQKRDESRVERATLTFKFKLPAINMQIIVETANCC